MATGTWMDSVKAKFGLDIKGFEAGLKKGAAGFAKFGVTIGGAIILFEPLKKVIQGTADAISLAGLAMQGLAAISTQTAARTQVLGTVMASVAKNMAISAGAAEQASAAIKKKGVTTEEARQSTIQFMQSELQLADAHKLARAAQDLAVAANMNSSEAMNTLMASVTSLEPMLLRQFGLTKNMTDIMIAYAIKLNKSAEALTSVERKQAIMNYIFKEAAKVQGNYERAMDDAGKKVTSFDRLIKEFQNDIGQAGLSVYKPIIDGTYRFLSTLNELPKPMKDLVGAVVILGSGVGTLVGPFTAVGFKLAEIGGLLMILSLVMKGAGVVFTAVSGLVGGVVSAAFAGFMTLVKVLFVEMRILWAGFTDGILSVEMLNVSLNKLSLTMVEQAVLIKGESLLIKEKTANGWLDSLMMAAKAKTTQVVTAKTWECTIAGKAYTAGTLTSTIVTGAFKLALQQLGALMIFVRDSLKELVVWSAALVKKFMESSFWTSTLGANVGTAWKNFIAFFTVQKSIIPVMDMSNNRFMFASLQTRAAAMGTGLWTAATRILTGALKGLNTALLWIIANPVIVAVTALVAAMTAAHFATKNWSKVAEERDKQLLKQSKAMADIVKMEHSYLNAIVNSTTADKKSVDAYKKSYEEKTRLSKELLKSREEDDKKQQGFFKKYSLMKNWDRYTKGEDTESKKTKEIAAQLDAQTKISDELGKQIVYGENWMTNALKFVSTLDEAKENLIKIKQVYQEVTEETEKNREELRRVETAYSGYFKRVWELWSKGKSWNKETIQAQKDAIALDELRAKKLLESQKAAEAIKERFERVKMAIDEANYTVEHTNRLYEVGAASLDDILAAKREEYQIGLNNLADNIKGEQRQKEALRIEVLMLEMKQMGVKFDQDRAKLQHAIALGQESERENLKQTRKEWEMMQNAPIPEEDKRKKKRQLEAEEKANKLLNYQLDIDLNKFLYENNRKSEREMRDYELSKLKDKLAKVKELTLRERMELNREIQRKEQEMAEFIIQQQEKTNSHMASLNQSDIRKQYIQEMQAFEARKKAGLLKGEKLLEEQRKMEQRAREVRLFDAQKSEEKFNRWKQAADLGHFNSKLLLENGGMKFTVTKYTEHYKEILAKHREMTEGIDQKEREQVTQYSKDMSKVYAEMGKYYAVSSDGTVKANDLILRTFRKSIYTTERELWFFQQNMGVKRVEAEQTKNDLLISSIASQLRKGDSLVGSKRAEWEKDNVKQIEEYKNALKRQDELHAELIRKKAEREQALADRRLSIEKRMQKFLEDQSMNETEKQKRQLEEDAAEALASGADKILTDKFLDAQLNKIVKEGKEREKEANKQLMESNKELADSNDELGQSFEDLGDSMNETKDKGDKWYKTISDFAGIGSSKTAPMFKAMNNLSSGMGKAVDMFGGGFTGAKGSENPMSMFRPDRMSVYGDNANSFTTERIMGGLTAKDMMAKASGQTIGAEERRKEEINKAAAMFGIHTGSVDPTAPTQIGGAARAEKTTEEKQKQQGTFNSESYDAGVDRIVAAIKEAKGSPAKVASNPALATNYNQQEKSGATAVAPISGNRSGGSAWTERL
jgi:hypothetical protein